MAYKPMNSLADGIFVDFEVINGLINNDKALRSEIPLVGYRSIDNSFFSSRTSPLRIQSGVVKMSGPGSSNKDVDVTLPVASSITPTVVLQVAETSLVDAYVVDLKHSSFTIRLVPRTGATTNTMFVSWIAVTIDTTPR